MMNLLNEIKQMSYSEKLMTMEQLWSELTNSDKGVPSPQWHKDILDAREGKHTYLDLADAKSMVRKSVNGN
jgi:hypothetical protein